MAGAKPTLHRESIGRDTGLDLFPGDGSGNRETLSHARRISADGGGATTVAEIVEEDTAAPVCLCGNQILLRFGCGERPHKPPRERTGRIMAHALGKRRHEMNALASGQLRPRI